jgi:hypothetical protein
VQPVLLSSTASAYNLLSARTVEMSSSADGTIAAGQNATYKVSFGIASSHNVGSVVVQFCDNSPIIGDSCNAPTGLNDHFATTLATANNTGSVTPLAVDTVNSTINRVVLTRTGGVQAVTNSDTVNVELQNITNPTNVNTTFYARLYTYTSVDGTTGMTDAGGVDLALPNKSPSPARSRNV